MFWIKRLRAADNGSSWALPYGDLMSLLLVIFVMIATMSELHAGERFDAVSRAVRCAFGFGQAQSQSLAHQPRLTLLERLEQAGLSTSTTVWLGEADHSTAVVDANSVQVEVVFDHDCLYLRMDSGVLFESFSAVMRPAGERCIVRLARLLVDGENVIEILARSGRRPVPEVTSFRDGFDLSYTRARAVADMMRSGGVSFDRLRVTLGHDGPPSEGKSNRLSQDLGGRIEIIVHAIAAVSHG